MNELKDIHLPDPVSWWPLAPGWWLVAVIVAVFVLFAVRQLLKIANKKKLKRSALTELERCADEHRSRSELGLNPSDNDQLFILQLVTIMRRCLLTVHSDSRLTSQSASQFLSALNHQATKPLFDEALIARIDELAYQKQPQPLSDDERLKFQNNARLWMLKQLGGKS
ncbi:DUF4381 domain-containing protein [Porticoccaceae bacterium LTM1]|nr:DUF4381 domain-containing protein [Porticoccaceae bacterium LTM1]